MRIIVPEHVPFRILFEIGMNYLRRNSNKKRESAIHLQDTIINYIMDDCSDIIDEFQDISIDITGKKIEPIIWVMWWQGKIDDNPIVNACISRLYSLSGFDVRLVTRENVHKYIDIDDIISLYEDERIYIQHLSDLIRIRLLEKYGGFWLDSSIAIIDDSYLKWVSENYSFFSNHLRDFDIVSNVSGGKFSTYFWGTFKNNPFFSFVDKMMTTFYINHRGGWTIPSLIIQLWQDIEL